VRLIGYKRMTFCWIRQSLRAMFGLQRSCSPPLMDERTNLLPIHSLDFRHLSWPARREFRCATVLNDLFDIFSAGDGASYRVEH